MILKYPVKEGNIIQVFGYDNSNHESRSSFYTLFENKHPGVDFAVPAGTKVFCSLPGVVVRREFHEGMGNVVGVRNGNIVVLYAHLSQFNVVMGQTVAYEDLIGLSGRTGSACLEPHLHFEIRDITKPTLKDMVFDPPFGKKITNLKGTFYYTVRNKNTKKTFRKLASMYFGKEENWNKIKAVNSEIKQNDDGILPDGQRIRIPNYK